MSDGARKRQKLKLNAPSKNDSPRGSRSGSPDVTNNAVRSVGVAGNGNPRVGSPGKSPFCSLVSSPT